MVDEPPSLERASARYVASPRAVAAFVKVAESEAREFRRRSLVWFRTLRGPHELVSSAMYRFWRCRNCGFKLTELEVLADESLLERLLASPCLVGRDKRAP